MPTTMVPITSPTLQHFFVPRNRSLALLQSIELWPTQMMFTKASPSPRFTRPSQREGDSQSCATRILETRRVSEEFAFIPLPAPHGNSPPIKPFVPQKHFTNLDVQLLKRLDSRVIQWPLREVNHLNGADRRIESSFTQ